MSKRILFVILLAIVLIFVCYYQFFSRPDVLNSSNTSGGGEVSENIDIVLNKMLIFDKEAIAEKLLEMRLQNSFQSTMFSTMSPDDIRFSVYLNPLTRHFYKEAFSFHCILKKDGSYEIKIDE